MGKLRNYIGNEESEINKDQRSEYVIMSGLDLDSESTNTEI